MELEDQFFTKDTFVCILLIADHLEIQRTHQKLKYSKENMIQYLT